MAKRLNEAQLDGRACVACGGADGAMVVCNTAEDQFYGREESQLHGHLACLERDPNLRKRGDTEKQWTVARAQDLVRASGGAVKHEDDPIHPGYCTCDNLTEACPVNPREWDPYATAIPPALPRHNSAQRLLDDLAHLMKLSHDGTEISRHHLVALHGDVVELLRDIGGYQELLDRFRL